MTAPIQYFDHDEWRKRQAAEEKVRVLELKCAALERELDAALAKLDVYRVRSNETLNRRES